MKASNVRDLSEEELAQQLDDTKKELVNLRVQQSTGQLERPTRLRELRRDLARINTVVTERKRKAATS